MILDTEDGEYELDVSTASVVTRVAEKSIAAAKKIKDASLIDDVRSMLDKLPMPEGCTDILREEAHSAYMEVVCAAPKH